MIRRRRFPWVLLSLVPFAFAGDADAGGPEIASFSGVSLLTHASWSRTAYGNKTAANNAIVVGGASDAGTLVDNTAPLDHVLAFQIQGQGKGCRLVMEVFDGHAPYGQWNGSPTAAWAFYADHLPFMYETTARAFFATNPNGGYGVATRLIRVVPSSKQPPGVKCTGSSQDTTVTFIAAGDYQSVLTGVGAAPIELHQTWPGPATKGTTFQMTVTGAGPLVAPVDVTLSGPAFPNTAHSATAKVSLIADANASSTGVFFPATLEGTTLEAFPELAKLSPGKYDFAVQVRGASGVAIVHPVTTHVRVDVAAPPPAKGAAMTSITPGAAGYFVGDKELLKVAGTPGDLGTCDSYGLALTPVTSGGGPGQSLTFKNKTFPESLVAGADFTALGLGVWQALPTPSGALCTGKPGDALVQVETPGADKDRPVLTMGSAAFVGQEATLTIAMPASYGALSAGGMNIACCDTELYFRNKAGAWAAFNGTINRNFTDSDDTDSTSDAGLIPYAEFTANSAAVEWALRLRATAPGQQFAWSNLARYTVQ